MGWEWVVLEDLVTTTTLLNSSILTGTQLMVVVVGAGWEEVEENAGVGSREEGCRLLVTIEMGGTGRQMLRSLIEIATIPTKDNERGGEIHSP